MEAELVVPAGSLASELVLVLFPSVWDTPSCSVSLTYWESSSSSSSASSLSGTAYSLSSSPYMSISVLSLGQCMTAYTYRHRCPSPR